MQIVWYKKTIKTNKQTNKIKQTSKQKQKTNQKNKTKQKKNKNKNKKQKTKQNKTKPNHGWRRDLASLFYIYGTNNTKKWIIKNLKMGGNTGLRRSV